MQDQDNNKQDNNQDNIITQDGDNQDKGSGIERLKQLKDKVPQVDIEQADELSSRFMRKVFKTFKILSALLIFLFVIILGCSILYGVFKGTPSLEMPEFDQEIFEKRVEQKSDKSKVKGGRKERKQVQSKYEKKIDKVVELFGNSNDKEDQECFDGLLEILVGLPENQRGDYISGMLSYMKDGKKYREKEGNASKFRMDQLAEWYNEEFEASKESLEYKIEEAKTMRMIAWSIAGSSFIAIIVVMMIPLLLQIEENTRKEKVRL